jgi:hypothetical protein
MSSNPSDVDLNIVASGEAATVVTLHGPWMSIFQVLKGIQADRNVMTTSNAVPCGCIPEHHEMQVVVLGEFSDDDFETVVNSVNFI